MSVKSFMRKCTVTAAAVSCFVFLCTAQQNGGGRMVMSIGDIFAIADSASSSIRVFQTGVSAAEEALSAARSQRLPDISVSASVSYLGDGILWDRNFGNPQKIGGSVSNSVSGLSPQTS